MPTVNKTQNTLERNKFVPSPTRQEMEAVEVYVGNDIVVSFDDNIESEFSDGDTSAVKAVYKTINGVKIGQFSSTYEEATIIGITRTAALDGDKIKYKTIGKFEDSSLNFPVNVPVYLGANGEITDIPPTLGFSTRLGSSNGSGAIQILIEEPIEL